MLRSLKNRIGHLGEFYVDDARWVITRDPADLDRTTPDAPPRRIRDVIGYRVEATDGELGRVDDFLVDDRSWAIRYAVVDTGSWRPGKHVLIASEWLTGVSWPDATLSTDLSRHVVTDAPAFDPDAQIDDRWERDYLAHFQKHGHFQTRATASPGFVRLKEHGEFEVATTDPDPRGWKVVAGTDGRTIGRVADLIAEPATMKVRYLDIDLESSVGHILLPVGYAQLSPRENRVTAEGVSVDDVERLPLFESLPVEPEYDDRFKEAMRER